MSCFGVYTDFSYFLPGLFQTFCCVLGAVFEISAVSATFCLVFSRHFAVFWVLFLRFLQFQLPFAWSFPDILDLTTFCCVLGAVLGISAVSATFSRVFPGFWAGFWVLFLGFLQFQLLFLGFSQAFGLGLGAVLEVLEITAPQVLPTVCAINLWLLNIMLI